MDVYCFQRKFPGWTLLLDGGRSYQMVVALIRWWTLINFLEKFQGGRLFQCGRLLIFWKNAKCNAMFPYMYFFKLQLQLLLLTSMLRLDERLQINLSRTGQNI